MGLFNKLGRQVEKVKQSAEGVAKNSETSQCPACDAQFDGTHEYCPECGEEMVGPTAATD